MTYREALLNPDIPWEKLIEGVMVPDKLFKYQFFYSEGGEENRFGKKIYKESFI